MSEISIDKQIELLEQQLAGLIKQKNPVVEEYYINKLNEKIIDAEKRCYKIKAIYVSTALYGLCENIFESIARYSIYTPFITKPLKYKGYTVYNNLHLKDDEIQIAI